MIKLLKEAEYRQTSSAPPMTWVVWEGGQGGVFSSTRPLK